MSPQVCSEHLRLRELATGMKGGILEFGVNQQVLEKYLLLNLPEAANTAGFSTSVPGKQEEWDAFPSKSRDWHEGL